MRAGRFVDVPFRCGRRLIVLPVCVATTLLLVVVVVVCSGRLLFLSFVLVVENVW